jgi:aminopeptidase N
MTFSQTAEDGLVMPLSQNVNAAQKDSVSIYYHGVPLGGGFGSFISTTHDVNTPVMWTLSEPYGAKDWWPCKNGNDDKADSIEIIITNPMGYVASSNGVVLKEWDEGGKHITWYKHRYPISSYLVAFAVTDFRVIRDSVLVGNKQLPFISYAFPEDEAYFRDESIYAKQAMTVYSNLFGDYPFINEKYGHTQFKWGGGMEHQTNSFVVSMGIHLTVHELGHQWFGDKITCGSWQDLWLNEGFASYLEWLYVEQYYADYAISDREYYRSYVSSLPDGSVFIVDTANISRLFSNRLTYTKGAFVAHMLRWKLGDSTFFRGMKQYLNDPALKYNYARTADLKRNLEQVSGKNLDKFFQQWVYGEGYPSYAVSWTANKNNWIKIKLNQTTSHASVSFYEMPVPLLFKSGSKDTTIVLDNTINEQEFWVNIGFVPDTVIFDPQVWLLSAKNSITKIPANAGSSDDIKLFPNPAPFELNISLKNPLDKNVSIQLYNSIGQLLISKQIETPGKDELIQIPTTALPRGVYWVRIRNEKGLNLVKKIMH